MSEKLGQSKDPMIHRVSEIRKDIPMTMIHGGDSWIKNDVAYKVKDIRKDSRVHIEVYIYSYIYYISANYQERQPSTY